MGSPIVTVDAVLLTLHAGRLKVALIQRVERDGSLPFAGLLALPGGFVRTRTDRYPDEEDVSAEAAVRRVLLQKTGFVPQHLEQLQVFSGATRDPRGWSVSVAFLALVPWADVEQSAAFAFYDVASLPELAFDHAEIIAAAVQRVRNKAEYSTIPCAFLAPEVTLAEIQLAYEAVLGVGLDGGNFRRKLKSEVVLEPSAGRVGGAHRPAQLYKNPGMRFLGRPL